MTKIDTLSLKTGDTVYVAQPGNHETTVRKYEVTKVTPKGQVVIQWHADYSDRFNAEGKEMGATGWRAKYLTTEEHFNRYLTEKAAQATRREIQAGLAELRLVTLDDLPAALDALKAKVLAHTGKDA